MKKYYVAPSVILMEVEEENMISESNVDPSNAAPRGYRLQFTSESEDDEWDDNGRY